MCLTPITIKNPHLGCSHVGINYLHDTQSMFIKVPCGSCQECVAMRQGFFLQRVQMESLRSHIFMFTLTYNDESLMWVDVGEYILPIPWYDDIQSMFKRLRSYGHKFRYFVCSEYGKTHFRPHYHGLLAVSKDDKRTIRTIEYDFYKLILKQWKRNYGTRVNPEYKPLCDFVYNRKHNRIGTYDFHYVEPIRDHDNDASFYVSKYITKFDSRTVKLLQKIQLDSSLTDEEITFLVDIIRPKRCMSKDFGDWRDPVINRVIQGYGSRESMFSYPQYYDIYTGKQMPMSPYYGKRIVGFEHYYDRFMSFSDDVEHNSMFVNNIPDNINGHIMRDSDLSKIAKWEKTQKNIMESLRI